jgi:hypothetical protein
MSPALTPVITLRDPIVVTRPPDPDEVDPEDAYLGALLAGFDLAASGTIAAYAAHLPVAVGEDDRPLGWSIREVRHLRFLKAVADRGGFEDDR